MTCDVRASVRPAATLACGQHDQQHLPGRRDVTSNVPVVSRGVTILTAVASIVLGCAFALYGVFAILYQGDSGGNGDTYVTVFGHRVDADAIGVASLAVAALALVIGVMLLRPLGSPSAGD
jgi:hypothetical protein